MGIMIDVDTLKAKMIKYGFHAIDMTVTEFVEDMLPTVEAIPKADIITMLEEIKDLANDECWDFDRELDITLSKEVVNLDAVENIIQQKIDKLKEIKDYGSKTNRSNSSVIRSRF